MQDQQQTGRDHWKGRSAAWTATAAEGLSTDDTFNQLIIENAEISPGERVLDIGSGTGDPAISIGLALDGAGAITASDLTPEMLAKARDRSVNVGLKVMSFAATDMSALAFDDNSFDCVTCRFGLMFPEDRVAAAREVRRVLKPGGRVAYVVWGPYEENPPFFTFRRAVAAALGEAEGPPPHRHSLSAPGQLIEILDAAGFSRTEERELRYKRPVDDLEDYMARGLKRGYSEDVERLGPDGHAALLDTLREAFEAYREDGMIRMPNYARMGLGWA